MITILFLAANPIDTEQLRLDEEIRAIDERLRRAEFRNFFEIKQHWAARVTDLQECFLRYKPNIVHFSGHGNTASEIILQDSEGKSHPVPAKALGALFSSFQKEIQCVVLNACYSEIQAMAIAEHIDCVIGMSKAISDPAARSFAFSFYQALGYRKSVSEAFRLGCGQIALEGLKEDETPMLINPKGNAARTFLCFGEEPNGNADETFAAKNSSGQSTETPNSGNLFFQSTYTFENRHADISRILSRLETEPYIHLHGPSGIGKTRLAKELLERHSPGHPHAYIEIKAQILTAEMLLRETHWQLYGDASIQKLSVLEVMDDWALRIKKNTSRYPIIVFDNFDSLASGVRRDWREKILPEMEEKIVNPALYVRFVTLSEFELKELVGRGRISFQSYLLREFENAMDGLEAYKGFLRQAVEKWGRKTSPDDELLICWSKELYTLTGGHPGSIVGILNVLGRQTHFAQDNVFTEQRSFVCREVLTPLIERQLQAQKIDAYQDAFMLLFVFRYLSKGIFRQLLNDVKNKPHWQPINAVTREVDYTEYVPIWERIIETPLLSHKDGQRLLTHQLTPTWRRLGNLLIRSRDASLYCALHHDVRLVFDHFSLDNHVTDAYFRMDCFIEALYHLCQEKESSSSEFAQCIFNRADQIIFSFSKNERFDDYLYNLERLLTSDHELEYEFKRIDQADTWQKLLDIVHQSGR